MRQRSGNLSKRIFLFFTVLTSILMGAGFGMAGQWFVDILILVLLSFMLLADKFNWGWAFSIFLLSNAIIAALGIGIGAPTSLMILGITTALASWELSNTEKNYKKIYSHSLSKVFEKNRFLWLGISLGSGLLIAEVSQFIQFRLPFFVIYLITIIIMLCFYQIYRILNENNQ